MDPRSRHADPIDWKLALLLRAARADLPDPLDTQSVARLLAESLERRQPVADRSASLPLEDEPV